MSKDWHNVFGPNGLKKCVKSNTCPYLEEGFSNARPCQCRFAAHPHNKACRNLKPPCQCCCKENASLSRTSCKRLFFYRILRKSTSKVFRNNYEKEKKHTRKSKNSRNSSVIAHWHGLTCFIHKITELENRIRLTFSYETNTL